MSLFRVAICSHIKLAKGNNRHVGHLSSVGKHTVTTLPMRTRDVTGVRLTRRSGHFGYKHSNAMAMHGLPRGTNENAVLRCRIVPLTPVINKQVLQVADQRCYYHTAGVLFEALQYLPLCSFI